ncbi:MAG: hypothetical protein J6T28_06230 [Paludibacteraceae bacterium]|nr:hypothetical protein [Paludibacteraceae bacterium]
MNKIFQIIIGALTTVAVIAFASCQEEDGGGTPEYTWPSKHYLQRYILPDSLIDPSWDYLSKIKKDSFLLGFGLGGESICSGECPADPQPPHPLYDSLVKMYHDTAWRGKTNYMYPAIAYPVSAISVVSDADFDDAHLAGSELIDIANIYSGSYALFVLNGYNGRYPQEDFLKPFCEYTQQERSLWNGASVGIYLPLPTLSRTHNLTVTFSFEGWKSVSSTVHVEL